MTETSSDKPPTRYQRPDPFILRLTMGVLKRSSYGVAIFCFVSAVLVGGFGLTAFIFGLAGWKPMDQRLVGLCAMCAFIFTALGRMSIYLSKK